MIKKQTYDRTMKLQSMNWFNKSFPIESCVFVVTSQCVAAASAVATTTFVEHCKRDDSEKEKKTYKKEMFYYWLYS